MGKASTLETKISVIVATRNRASNLERCLDAAVAALTHAGVCNSEIIVVDNGSTDNTAEVARSWASRNSIFLNLLFEGNPGKSRALNMALASARGEFLIFTDDDCCLDLNHCNDLHTHFFNDRDIVIRGGRIELGDPSDLPITINTDQEPMRWTLRNNSVRHDPFLGRIVGANMVTRRQLFDRIGPFDENFGPGAAFGPCDDTDILCRAYLSGATLEYVPNMRVFHFHGRKTAPEAASLMGQYEIGNGALFVKFGLQHPEFCRPLLWAAKGAIKELATRSNLYLPEIGFSYRDKVIWTIRGALRYAVYA